MRLDSGILIVNEQQRFPVKDGGGVLHGAGFKIRQPHHVQLAVWIFNSVILVVVFENLLCVAQSHYAQWLLVWSAAHPDGNPVSLAFIALEISNRHGYQVS